MEKDLKVLQSQRLPNKLYVAGSGDYDKIWIRDNVYVAMALVEAGQVSEAAEVYAGLFSILERRENVLNSAVYPTDDSQLVHPRYSATGDTIPGPWSNKQHDAIGALLFGAGQMYAINPAFVTTRHQEICQKLIHYLETCRYWQDTDHGIWEEDLGFHASSLAACIKGIEMVSDFCNYDNRSHEIAKKNLEDLLPYESSEHKADMALLSLVWPYGYKRQDIVDNVEDHLLRQHGVIRYVGDDYEATGDEEPQWIMGIPWLGIAYLELGRPDKARHYLAATEKLYTNNGLPESYLANNAACIHTPLAWSHAMALILRKKLSSLN